LSFYKNESAVNQLFQKEIESTMDYRVVFKREESSYFDEWHGINRKFELSGMQVWNDDSFLFDIDKNRYHLHTTDDSRHGVWISSPGKVFMADNSNNLVEGAYVHLQKRTIFVPEPYRDGLGYLIQDNTIIEDSNVKFGIPYRLRMRYIFLIHRLGAFVRKIRKDVIAASVS
jgi:hypothetical protein